MTKASGSRNTDDRPLCYSGQAGHMYRDCQYRTMRLRGFHQDARRPRYGELPKKTEQYLTGRYQSLVRQRRQSRSPSTRRLVSPNQNTNLLTSAGSSGSSPLRAN
ncbi:hypothetical protein HPB50_010462 [Hyalomma asiaticum]|uniref:Uncharacterized protein n=1 Tax=Hyalomma asiaticum TaxID=266040 RepID=A0ACB7TFN2_HYAAI|nr:hypothetical protein HPB50_010462 [Hyalomma asiaticum]